MRRIIRRKTTCPRCHGKGRIWDKEACVFTFGLGVLFQAIDDSFKAICPRCGGDGEVWEEMEMVELP